MKLREKLVYRYLPLWAKETVLRENKILVQKVERLERENAELRAFINGFKVGAKMDGDGE